MKIEPKNMIKYYQVKEEFNSKFSELEKAMITADTVRLRELNAQYKELLEQYKQFTNDYLKKEGN